MSRPVDTIPPKVDDEGRITVKTDQSEPLEIGSSSLTASLGDPTQNAAARTDRLMRVPRRTGTWDKRDGNSSSSTVAFVPGYGWTFNVSSETQGNPQSVLRFSDIRGNRIGVQYKAQWVSSVANPTQAFIVDGEVVTWPKEGVRTNADVRTASPNPLDGEQTWILPIEDLDDIAHVVEIAVTAATSGTKRILIRGFLLPESAGYHDTLPLDLRTAPTQIAVHATNATAAPTLVGPANFQLDLDYATKYILTNPAGSGDAAVIVTDGGGNVWTETVVKDTKVVIDLAGREPVNFTFRVNTGGITTAYVTVVGGFI